MRLTIFLLTGILLYCILIPYHADRMRMKSYVEKVGAVPRGEVLRLMSADHKQLVAAMNILNVIFYFGGTAEASLNKMQVPIDYPAMSRVLHSAVKTDPYNADAYYFAEAILVWHVGQIQLANTLLEYGMKYRTWDWYLPFFAGFNNAYFLKDYAKAAQHYRTAAELTGDDLIIRLTGRFMHEAGQTDHALAFLQLMLKSAKNESVKQNIAMRLKALQGIKVIEIARDDFHKSMGRMPKSVDELVSTAFLPDMPKDPYGGRFYLEPSGMVRTTSQFVYQTNNISGNTMRNR